MNQYKQGSSPSNTWGRGSARGSRGWGSSRGRVRVVPGPNSWSQRERGSSRGGYNHRGSRGSRYIGRGRSRYIGRGRRGWYGERGRSSSSSSGGSGRDGIGERRERRRVSTSSSTSSSSTDKRFFYVDNYRNSKYWKKFSNKSFAELMFVTDDEKMKFIEKYPNPHLEFNTVELISWNRMGDAYDYYGMKKNDGFLSENKNEEEKKRKIRVLIDDFKHNYCFSQSVHKICPKGKNCEKYHILLKSSSVSKWFSSLSQLKEYDKKIKQYDDNNIKLYEKNIVPEKVPIRGAAIMPYCKIGDKLFILFAYEHGYTKAFRVFLGRRDGRYDSDCIDTALRKFVDETNAVFDKDFNKDNCFSNISETVRSNLSLFKNSSMVTNCIIFSLQIHNKYFMDRKILKEAMLHHLEIEKKQRISEYKNEEMKKKNDDEEEENQNWSKYVLKRDFKWISWERLKSILDDEKRGDVEGDICGVCAPISRGDLKFLKKMEETLDSIKQRPPQKLQIE